jgi:hypothetical protein
MTIALRPTTRTTQQSWSKTAQALRIQTQDVRTVEDFEPAFLAGRAWDAEAFFATAGRPMSAGVFGRVSELAARIHPPAVYGRPSAVAVGGLMSFSENLPSSYRQGAMFWDRQFSDPSFGWTQVAKSTHKGADIPPRIQGWYCRAHGVRAQGIQVHRRSTLIVHQSKRRRATHGLLSVLTFRE